MKNKKFCKFSAQKKVCKVGLAEHLVLLHFSRICNLLQFFCRFNKTLWVYAELFLARIRTWSCGNCNLTWNRLVNKYPPIMCHVCWCWKMNTKTANWIQLRRFQMTVSHMRVIRTKEESWIISLSKVLVICLKKVM